MAVLLERGMSVHTILL